MKSPPPHPPITREVPVISYFIYTHMVPPLSAHSPMAAVISGNKGIIREEKRADEGKVVPSKEISSHYKTLPPPPPLSSSHPSGEKKAHRLLSACFLDIRFNKLCFLGCQVWQKGGEHVSRWVWESIIPLKQRARPVGIARD